MKNALLLFAIIFTINATSAADLYWIGNGGDWSDVNHWSLTSGGSSCNCLPTQNDNVYFDANSFSSGGQTVMINQEAYCKSMDWTGARSSTTFAGGAMLHIYGSLKLNSSMNITYSGSFSFESSDVGNTITTYGKTLPFSIHFNGLGGEWTLQDNFTTSSTIYLNAGSLNTNGVAITGGFDFGVNNQQIRSLTLGSSIVTLNGTWRIWNVSNLTIDAGTSTIISNSSFYGWNFTYYNVSILGGGEIYHNNTFHNLTLGTSTSTINQGTQTINGNFTLNGTCSVPAILTGGTLNKTSGSVTIDYVRLKNVTATGGATFTADNVTDFGGNNGWYLNTPSPQNFYWVGNGGNWSDAFHWSNTSGGTSSGCIPSPYDNIYFDANSFSSGGQTVMINQEAYCKSMDWTGARSSTTFAGGAMLHIYGSLKLNSSMNITYSGSFSFESSDVGNTITTYGKTLPFSIHFNGLGGEWTLQDNFTTSSTIYLNAGSLNTNGVAITGGFDFGVNNQQIRSLTLGSSIVTLNGTWRIWNVSNLTIDAGTSTIISNSSFYGWNFTYYNVSILGGGEIYHNNTFHNLTLGTSTSTINQGTQTINGNFTLNGTCSVPAILTGGTLNKTSGSVTIDYVRLKNVTATGGATFTADNVTDFGGNNGWYLNTPSPQNFYWVGNGGNWSDAFHWSNTSGGTSSGCIPSPYDNIYFDANSFSSGGQTVMINQEAYCKSMDWTGARSSTTFAGGAMLHIYGSLKLNSSMNITYSGSFSFESSDVGNTITTYGKTLPFSIHFNGLGGEWTLQDNFTTSSTIYLNAGSLNTNGVAITGGFDFGVNNQQIRSLTLGSSIVTLNGTWRIWNVSNLTIDAGTSTIISNSSFYGWNFTYYNVSILGGGEIYHNNTFHNLTLGTSTSTINQGTQTINGEFICNGTAAIHSSFSGGMISKATGTVCLNYVNISNSVATGGAEFYAGNSQNLGGNTGWLFQSCTSNTIVTLLSPGNNIEPGYTVHSLNPFFIWTEMQMATNYQLQLYKKTSGNYALIYDNDNIVGNSITPPTGTITDVAQYYWQVRAKIGGSWMAYSSPFYFNVTVTSLSPIIFLSSSIIQSGEDLAFSGINFTSNNQVRVVLSSNSGFDSAFTINSNNEGRILHSLVLNEHGLYTIYCKDILSGSLSNQKSFEVQGSTVNYFTLINPNNGYQTHVNNEVQIKWNDKLVLGNMYPIVGSQRAFNYIVEKSTNSGSSWQTIATLIGYDDIDKFRSFSTEVTFTEPSSNCLIRIKDGYNTSRTTSNVSIQILAGTTSDLKADFIWDYSYQERNGQPIGVVTDGTSRFYIKIYDPVNTITGVTVSLFDDDNNTETRILGKLKGATNISSYDEEANNANLLSVTVNTAINDTFWVWYVAPDDFIGNNTPSNSTYREVNVRIQAQYTNGSSDEITKTIQVERPPVVLVHGLNSSPDVWQYYNLSPSFWKYDKFALNIGGKASYVYNARSLLFSGDPNYSIPACINSYRKNQKIVCNQIYYIGHSMGGVVLRFAQSNLGNYFSSHLNYNKGFVNKFITLDTPHRGSPLADFLIYKLPYISLFPIINPFIKDYYKTNTLGFVTDVHPAFRDLKMNTHLLLATNFKSHVFAGDIVEGLQNFSSVPASIIDELEIAPLLLIGAKFLTDKPTKYQVFSYLDSYYSSFSHSNSITNTDFIVPLLSQLSDLQPYNSNLVTITRNFHSEATGSPSIERNTAGQVATLLDKPIGDWEYLPLVQPQISNKYLQQLPKFVIDSASIEILQPTNYQSIIVDSLFNLVFSVSDTLNLKMIKILYQDKYVIDTIPQLNYNLYLNVSNNYLDTQMVYITANYVYNDSIKISFSSVPVIVNCNSEPIRLESENKFVYLIINEDYDLNMKLYFPNFISKLGTNGTKLNVTFGDPSIFSYDKLNKRLTAIKDGDTYVIINYNSLVDTIYFKVRGSDITGIDDDNFNTGNNVVPNKYELFQCYPNPFNPSTTIKYSIPTTSIVNIKIYDILGREVATLVNEEKIAGNYLVQFNGSNFSSGVYFYRIQAGDFVETKKMVFLK